MAKMVLIEAHPLLRLGLWQILSKLDDVWEIEGTVSYTHLTLPTTPYV